MCLSDILSESIDVVTREEWGALPPKKPSPIKNPVPYVYLDISTGTPNCKNQEECIKIVKEMQKKHMDAGMTDIQYNFLLSDDGTVYEGRGWKERPHRLRNFPSMDGRILEFGCIGDYSDKLRPEAMYRSQWDLLAYGIQNKYLTKECSYW